MYNTILQAKSGTNYVNRPTDKVTYCFFASYLTFQKHLYQQSLLKPARLKHPLPFSLFNHIFHNFFFFIITKPHHIPSHNNTTFLSHYSHQTDLPCRAEPQPYRHLGWRLCDISKRIARHLCHIRNLWHMYDICMTDGPDSAATAFSCPKDEFDFC